jgi:hypothetical protein
MKPFYAQLTSSLSVLVFKKRGSEHARTVMLCMHVPTCMSVYGISYTTVLSVFYFFDISAFGNVPGHPELLLNSLSCFRNTSTYNFTHLLAQINTYLLAYINITTYKTSKG